MGMSIASERRNNEAGFGKRSLSILVETGFDLLADSAFDTEGFPETSAVFLVVLFPDIGRATSRDPVMYGGEKAGSRMVGQALLGVAFLEDDVGKASTVALDHNEDTGLLLG